MAELRASIKSNYIEGMEWFQSRAVLSGCGVDVEFEDRTSPGKDKNSVENTIINWALIELESVKEINSSNLPVLNIIKKHKGSFTKGAKDSIKKLEDRGIEVRVKIEK